MRRDDSVFFFTLVDFLLTALFFGLMLFAIGRERSAREKHAQTKLASAVDSLSRATGISDITILTDRLTRLGPLKNAEIATQLVMSAGGPAKAKKALATVAEAGGSDTVAMRLERLRQQEGAGKPHCLFTEVAGRKEATVLASVVATDSSLAIEHETPQLRAVLTSMRRTFSEVRTMSLHEFRRTFEQVLRIQPGCLYTINFIERTRYVDARDAARGLFYMRIHRITR
jgi:hypothetical protein